VNSVDKRGHYKGPNHGDHSHHFWRGGKDKELSVSAEWLLKKRITSKSDGDSLSGPDEFHLGDHQLKLHEGKGKWF